MCQSRQSLESRTCGKRTNVHYYDYIGLAGLSCCAIVLLFGLAVGTIRVCRYLCSGLKGLPWFVNLWLIGACLVGVAALCVAFNG